MYQINIIKLTVVANLSKSNFNLWILEVLKIVGICRITAIVIWFKYYNSH